MFCKRAKFMTHFRVKRTRYFHHFIVLGFKRIDDSSGTLTVVHYTTSYPIASYNDNPGGKFITESVKIKNGEKDEKNLLDFEKGVYIVENENYPQKTEEIRAAYNRLLRRMNEEAYHVSCNNCEHIVNFILTGRHFSIQAHAHSGLAHAVSAATAEIKDIGITTLITLSFLISIAGALLRHAYVRIIIATFISLIAEIGNFDCSFGKFESNILANARWHFSEALTFPHIKDIPNVSPIIKTIEDEMNDQAVCEIARKQVILLKYSQFVITLISWILIETLFLVFFYHCSLLPLKQRHDLPVRQALVVRACSGYLSSVCSITCGEVAELNWSVKDVNSAVWFFIISFPSSVVFRVIFVAFVGTCFHYCGRHSDKNTHKPIIAADDSLPITSESLEASNKNVRGTLCCEGCPIPQFGCCVVMLLFSIAAVIAIAEKCIK